MITFCRGCWPTYEDLLRLPGRQTGPAVSPGLRHQGDEGQLWEVLGGHLQPTRHNRLERQLYGPQESEDPPGQVCGSGQYLDSRDRVQQSNYHRSRIKTQL